MYDRDSGPAVANFGFSLPACETKTITFTDSSTVPAGVGVINIRTWDFGDGTPPVIRTNNAPFTHTFASAGNYLVKLIVTTAGGCNSLVKEKWVNVKPQPLASFRFTDTACLPNALIQFGINPALQTVLKTLSCTPGILETRQRISQ